jgi:hypothetical protein
VLLLTLPGYQRKLETRQPHNAPDNNRSPSLSHSAQIDGLVNVIFSVYLYLAYLPATMDPNILCFSTGGLGMQAFHLRFGYA